jgi:hypothetical protein
MKGYVTVSPSIASTHTQRADDGVPQEKLAGVRRNERKKKAPRGSTGSVNFNHGIRFVFKRVLFSRRGGKVTENLGKLRGKVKGDFFPKGPNQFSQPTKGFPIPTPRSPHRASLPPNPLLPTTKHQFYKSFTKRRRAGEIQVQLVWRKTRATQRFVSFLGGTDRSVAASAATACEQCAEQPAACAGDGGGERCG